MKLLGDVETTNSWPQTLVIQLALSMQTLPGQNVPAAALDAVTYDWDAFPNRGLSELSRHSSFTSQLEMDQATLSDKRL